MAVRAAGVGNFFLCIRVLMSPSNPTGNAINTCSTSSSSGSFSPAQANSFTSSVTCWRKLVIEEPSSILRYDPANGIGQDAWQRDPWHTNTNNLVAHKLLMNFFDSKHWTLSEQATLIDWGSCNMDSTSSLPPLLSMIINGLPPLQ